MRVCVFVFFFLLVFFPLVIVYNEVKCIETTIYARKLVIVVLLKKQHPNINTIINFVFLKHV